MLVLTLSAVPFPQALSCASAWLHAVKLVRDWSHNPRAFKAYSCPCSAGAAPCELTSGDSGTVTIAALLCQPAKAIKLSKTWSFLSVSSVLNLFNALPLLTVGQMEISTGTGTGAGRREPGTSADVDLCISLQSCFYLLMPSPCKSSVLRHRAGMNSRRWERGIYCPSNAASRTILSGCSLSLGVLSLKGRAGA